MRRETIQGSSWVSLYHFRGEEGDEDDDEEEAQKLVG
jgi:hypothetical protein